MLQIKADFFNLVNAPTEHTMLMVKHRKNFFMIMAEREDCSLSLLLFNLALGSYLEKWDDDFYRESMCKRLCRELRTDWKMWQDCWI